MKIYKCEYTQDPVNGITITSATEMTMHDSIAEIRLKHNNVLNGGRFLSESDLLKIYKPKSEQNGITEKVEGTQNRTNRRSSKRDRGNDPIGNNEANGGLDGEVGERVGFDRGEGEE